MAVELVMPKLGLSMTKGKIVKWFKKEGDLLKKGDEVLLIETEKLTNIIEAPANGVLLKILYGEGEVKPIRAPLAYIGEPGEQLQIPVEIQSVMVERKAAAAEEAEEPAVPAQAETAKFSRIKITPAAKNYAEKRNINYSNIKGTGPDGRITKEDIIAYCEAKEETAAAVQPTAQLPAAEQEKEFDTMPYAGMRKAIGDNMSLSWSVAPRVTKNVQVDVTELLELRARLNDNLREDQVKLTINDLMTKIVARALKRMPIINSSLDGDIIKLYKTVNISTAVALDNGLVAPVVKNADKKDVFTISKEIKDLSNKAKTGSLQENDMEGGTFTVSNIGSYDSVDFFSPIINQPESAILGVCRTKKAPVVVNDEIVIRSVMGLSLTYDHRVIDGATAAQFLAVIIELLKNPARSIFE